jgi:hypothetical protein
MRNRMTEFAMRTHENDYQETISTDMHGWLTKLAWRTNRGISVLLMPLSVLNPFTTAILGLIGVVTLKIALVPFFIVGALMIGWLLGTSWLWLKVPILRPLVFLLGVIIAPLCLRYVGWIPAFSRPDIRLRSINLCASWPLSLALWRRTESH